MKTAVRPELRQRTLGASRPDYATENAGIRFASAGVPPARLAAYAEGDGALGGLTLSWNLRIPVIAVASFVAIVSLPALAHAQWGGWGPSAARIQVTPRHTEVYVDGYRAGVADDFDGIAQRLRVEAGEHVIELYLDGHKPIAQTIMFVPGQSYRIRQTMEPLADGEAAPARPQPRAARASTQSGPFDAFGRPLDPGSAPGSGAVEGATIAIRVQPGDAAILVDGERWQGSGGDRLEIQVTPGEHRIEVQKDGYQPFTSTIRVGPGETSAVNISLTKSAA